MIYHGDDSGASASRAADSEQCEPEATPYNVASGKYEKREDDSLPPDNFLPLVWGVDTLHVSFRGAMLSDAKARLEQLKAYAQDTAKEHLAQAAAGGQIFAVSDKGRRFYTYLLSNACFDIQLSDADAPKIPVAYVKVRSQFLASYHPEQVLKILLSILQQFCTIESHLVSRADLYLDFCCYDPDIRHAEPRQFVTRADVIRPYYTDQVLTGWDVGLGSDLSARIYDKCLEITRSKKDYVKPIWQEAGWNGEETVWRIEFQLRRPVLEQLMVSSVQELVRRRGELWTYFTREWLRLCIPHPTDSNRARWAISPLWLNIWDGGCGSVDCPLRKRVQQSDEPEDAEILHRLCGILSTLFAVKNITDLKVGMSWLGLHLHDALRHHVSPKGIRLDMYLREQIKKKIRRYGLRLNDESLNNPGNFYD